MCRRTCPGLMIACAAWLACSLAWAEVVVYPRAETPGDRRDDYPVDLLTLALQKTGKPYELKPEEAFMLQVRAISELERGGLDVLWTMTTAEREKMLLPVRIPIDRGMLGWRLLLVRQNALPRFAAVTTPGQLKALTAGQGFDWPDTPVLREAGFTVDTSVRYADIFRKLASGRIDYFPRSVQEIWDELELHAGEGLAVEPTLALHYPAAMYFFVSRDRPALGADIRKGLEAALADGSFEALFQRHFGAALKRADLARRSVIELANPLLPPQTPLGDRSLWYLPAVR